MGIRPKNERRKGYHGIVLDLHRELIRLRRDTPAPSNLSKENLDVWEMQAEKLVIIRRPHNNSRALCLMNFNRRPVEVAFPSGKETWKKAVDTSRGDVDGARILCAFQDRNF